MKRRIFIAAIFLLAGTILNVGVAWASAAWHYVGQAPRIAGATPAADGNDTWMVASYRSRLAHRMHSLWGPMGPVAQDPQASPRKLARGWEHILGPSDDEDRESAGARVCDMRGWPFRSMWSALELEVVTQQRQGATPVVMAGDPTRVIRGIKLGLYTQFQREAPQHRFRVIPLGIIWPAFVVNTVVYAVGCLVLLLLLFWSRVAIRVGAGRCPGCSYDLRHATHECPECGRLARPGSLGTRAARRLRRAVLGAWCAVLLAALAGVGVWLWPLIGDHDWDAYKPTSWLVSGAKHPDQDKRTAALDELLRRLRDDKLDEDRIVSLVRDALAVQADVEQAWTPQWGDIVVAARSMKLVSDADWRTFARQAVVPELVARPRLVVGDFVAARLFFHKRAPSEPVLVIQLRHEETTLGPQTFPHRRRQGGMTTQLSQALPGPGPEWPTFIDFDISGRGRFRSPWPMAMPSADFVAEVAPGHHVLKCRWRVVISEGASGGQGVGYTTTADLFDGTIGLQTTVEVLPLGSETVERVADESLRSAVEACLSLRYCRARISPRVILFPDGVMSILGGERTTAISGMFDIETPPVDLAFDVFVRAAGQEWLVGQIDSESEHPWDFSGAFGGPADGLNETRVDVILRPSADAARRTLRITKIWDGEIVIRDVTLRWKNRP